jgi:uncharacterized iron-regulated membrane protein
VLRRRPQSRLPEARHGEWSGRLLPELITYHFAHLPLVADMASGQVLRVRQLGQRGGGQGAVPGDPGRILRS